VSVVGKSNMYMVKEFDKDDINAISRVVVSVGNPLAKTTAGRVQMAEQLLQMGLITNPKQYLQIINTGELEVLYEGDFKELMNIKRENEFLMEGKGDSVYAIYLDSHKEHIMEHRTLLSDPDLRQNVQLVQSVMKHIQEHIDLLRTVDPDLLLITNQTPLQNPNEMQMPPPMMEDPMQQGPGGPPLGKPKKPGPMSQMMQQQNGMPDPSQFMRGQGIEGGQMIPQPATPPPPFENLPTDPSQMVPQG